MMEKVQNLILGSVRIKNDKITAVGNLTGLKK